MASAPVRVLLLTLIFHAGLVFKSHLPKYEANQLPSFTLHLAINVSTPGPDGSGQVWSDKLNAKEHGRLEAEKKLKGSRKFGDTLMEKFLNAVGIPRKNERLIKCSCKNNFRLAVMNHPPIDDYIGLQNEPQH